MSFPVEAGPESPGHVGHTPQHVDVMLRRARARGITTSGIFTSYAPVPIAMQPTAQPQGFARLSQTAALMRVEDFRRRMDPGQPWPSAFDRGVVISEAAAADRAAGLQAPAPKVPGAPTRLVEFLRGGPRS